MNAQPLAQFIRQHVVIHRPEGQVIARKADCAYVDVYLFTVEVPLAALAAFRDDFIELVRAHPWHAQFRSGINYVDAAGPDGFTGQAQALIAFALGQMLGLWQVVTPLLLGTPEPAAGQQARGGFITITGYKG